MRKTSKLIGTVAATALLAGCTAVITNDSPGPRANYFDGDFEYATHRGAMIAIVAGNPFGIPQDRFESAVRQAMQNNVSTGDANFVATENGQTLMPYKVVAAFNARPGISDDEVCRQGAQTPTAPTGDSLSARMVFCEGDSSKSGATAWISGVQAVSDEGFHDLVKQTTLAMIPFQDSEEQGESNIP